MSTLRPAGVIFRHQQFDGLVLGCTAPTVDLENQIFSMTTPRKAGFQEPHGSHARESWIKFRKTSAYAELTPPIDKTTASGPSVVQRIAEPESTSNKKSPSTSSAATMQNGKAPNPHSLLIKPTPQTKVAAHRNRELSHVTHTFNPAAVRQSPADHCSLEQRMHNNHCPAPLTAH
ncbi:hypothetical protein H2Y56_18785 [Pectobacterium aroidearum]|uniref:Uncharacterized protein n=1 Tax=Pectobacterium aroidearum TaxID=1201031 RepID=A0ABR5ZI01_9GAMM|nr:hypothetical protein [Pectobacterium aroidearum]MBA5201362.1 hypothetical protein [Pectobacterium aroidearum]MBA5234140.1 hypothetical protein [Pectobacterium aroidearum]MBA5739332.1 hypothetical protein [Pectobacterium aroidearum]